MAGTLGIDLSDCGHRAFDAGIRLAETADDPAKLILDYAQASEAAMIVVGTHGRRGLRRLVMGSVAQSVVRSADRPVLVVPSR